jgi:D-alanyl-D-alanine dipeptidase
MSRSARFITVIALVVIFLVCQKFNFVPITTLAVPITQLSQLEGNNIVEEPSPPVLTAPQNASKSPLPYDARLIDIGSVDSKIVLDMRYATTNNFLKKKLYPVSRCVLRGAAVKRISQVQDYLAKTGLGLKVYDCYRPLSVQKQMWQALPDSRFVANPSKGSRHNRGSAVDVTLVDRNHKELEMPTGFDNFTEKAYRDYNGASTQAKKNRKLLEDAMKKYGFIPLSTEWWHFDAPGWENFSVLDVGFGEIPK